MNFFDAQDRARRSTRWLVFVYLIATLLVVAGVTLVVAIGLNAAGLNEHPANPAIITTAAAASLLLILGATLFKTARLSSGGGRVAQDMGGTRVTADASDPLRRRLRNVVEEMAIASGMPVPEIYVLEQESAINAFAAGFTQGDAAVAVTRGTLELLERDELQGVVAHEFSHILNGDMRLNIRLMGVLFGIMVIGLIGRTILRSSRHSSRSRNSGGVVFIGLGLLILGWVGVFFARLIKAGVSRQREFLADASAVQFTRQTDGIANALKKIGGFSKHSYIKSVDPEEISHMLFAGGIAGLANLFATHPPLVERIRALDPGFEEADYPRVERYRLQQAAEDQPTAAFAGNAHDAVPAMPATGDIAAAVGRPQPQHVGYARRLRASIPAALYDAAHAVDGSFLLAIALALDPQQCARQLKLLQEQMGAERAARVADYLQQLHELGPRYHLPLLEIAFPALKARPESQIDYLLDLVRRLIEIDGKLSLREFCVYRILQGHLQQAAHPAADRPGNRVARNKARRAALDVVQIVAEYGNQSPEDRQHAYQAGISAFGAWADGRMTPTGGEQTLERLGHSLDILRRINTAGRKSLLQAVSNTITHDGKLTLAEAELLRAICASLDCPLPPLAVT
ncbi:MAG: M48 family metallopeptidase [Woeseiaceae bacterium]|nr:M48 family metallopeptidase [Woeseiaceae bacterium]